MCVERKRNDYIENVLRLYPELVKGYDHLDQRGKQEVEAVEAAFDMLRTSDMFPEEKMDLCCLVFFEGRTLTVAADKCHISYATAKRWKSQIIELVGKGLPGACETSESPHEHPEQ